MSRLSRVIFTTLLALLASATAALASSPSVAIVSFGTAHVVRPMSSAVAHVGAGQTYGVRAWVSTSTRPAGHVVLTVREARGRRTVTVRSAVRRLTRSQVLGLTFRTRRAGDSLGVLVRTAAPRTARVRLSVRRVQLSLVAATRAGRHAQASASSAGSVPCPQAFGSFSTAAQPPACWRPYGDSSPLNQQIPANPRVYPQSSSIVKDLVENGVHFEDGPDKFALVTPGRQPVYWSQPSDPAVTIKCTYYWGSGTCRGDDGRSIDGTTIHIPAGALPENATDRRMSVIDQTTHTEYDFDHATWSSDHRELVTYSAGTLKIGTPDATGFGNGTTAGSLGNLAGIITPRELLAGQINHALSISLPCTKGYVWPASGANGFDCNQIPGRHDTNGATPAPMGALFQLDMSDAEIAATGAPRWEQAVMRAMAHYGLYVNDTNGTGDAHSIETELVDDETYTSFNRPSQMGGALKQLGGSYYSPLSRWILAGLPISVDKLRVIDPCVKHGTCS